MFARVLTSPEADEQALAIDEWWRENRPAAPHLFAEELATALDLLAPAPLLGRPYPHPEVPGLRRLLLRATRYHVYYAGSADAVLVLAVWSAVRGTGPDLAAIYRKSSS